MDNLKKLANILFETSDFEMTQADIYSGLSVPKVFAQACEILNAKLNIPVEKIITAIIIHYTKELMNPTETSALIAATPGSADLLKKTTEIQTLMTQMQDVFGKIEALTSLASSLESKREDGDK